MDGGIEGGVTGRETLRESSAMRRDDFAVSTARESEPSQSLSPGGTMGRTRAYQRPAANLREDNNCLSGRRNGGVLINRGGARSNDRAA